MKYFNSLPKVSIPIAGSHKEFLIHRIFCIGRNYNKHINEMGYHDVGTPLILFLKPPEAAVPNGIKIPIPHFTQDLQHEVELVVSIGFEGKNIPEKNALKYVFGYSVGIDLTCRDIQKKAKEKGYPWTLAKSIPQSAPMSDITPVSQSGHLKNSHICLSINGKNRQEGQLSDMIRPVSKIISEISDIYTIFPGDLIFTGTLDGVGKLNCGDIVHAEIDKLQSLTITII